MNRPESSPSDRLPVGLIAGQAGPASVTFAMLRDAGMEPVAVAGARRAGFDGAVTTYDDPRVLIVQSGVKALIMDTDTRAAAELADVATQHGIHVWRPGPMACGFTDATQIALRQRERTPLLRIGSWWEHVRESFAALSSPLPAFTPWHADLERFSPDRPDLAVDAALTGGGALVQTAYELIEALAAIRGLPETVMATAGRLAGRRAESATDREDFCAATLRYADGGCASVRVGWGLSPSRRRLALHGAGAAIEIGEGEIRVLDTAGRATAGAAIPIDVIATELSHFTSAVRGGQARAPEFERHIAATAIIETIYLAARTGQPETPRKLYEVQSWPLPQA